MRRRPRVYFSFRSPYSWMGLIRLRRAVPDADEVLDLIPMWEPDEISRKALEERGGEWHYTPMSKAKHLYILGDTKRLSARMGLRMAWPVDVDPWWELPHLGWLAARRVGAGTAFYDEICAARWERGENICDPAVVADAARRAGLDPDAIVRAPEDPAIRAEGVDCLMSASDDDIFGIPYFRVGRHRFWGVDRLDDFLDALLPALGRDPVPAAEDAEVAAGPAGGVDVPVGAYDTDTAGGCG